MQDNNLVSNPLDHFLFCVVFPPFSVSRPELNCMLYSIHLLFKIVCHLSFDKQTLAYGQTENIIGEVELGQENINK